MLLDESVVILLFSIPAVPCCLFVWWSRFGADAADVGFGLFVPRARVQPGQTYKVVAD
jgi:hypothetical protein